MTDQSFLPVSVGTSAADWLEIDGWYRPEGTRFHDTKRSRVGERTYEEIKRHVLDGWLPPAPFISRDKLVTAFGSCFAFHVENWLRHEGFTTSIGRYGNPDSSNYWSNSLLVKSAEGFVNTWSLRYQLEWLFEGDQPAEIWAKMDGRIQRYLDDNRDAGRKLLDETEVFIITLGLAEVWYRKAGGKVQWAGVPKSQYDPALFDYKVSSVVDNLANLIRIVSLIRKHRGDVPIVFTLSPVPLLATFRPVSCISANSVSKAVLRVAVDELMRAKSDDSQLFYFPSYEIVTSYLKDAFQEGDHHEPTFEAIHTIMGVFFRHGVEGLEHLRQH